MDRAKTGRWGQGAANSGRKRRTNVSELAETNVLELAKNLSSHLLSSSEISRPSSDRVSACSLIGSPRCYFTFIRNVALPARTRCVSRQTISRRISASGAVASVSFPPCPIHSLITFKTDSLSHNRRASSLRAVDCNANIIPPRSSLFELMPSSQIG